MGEQFRNGWIRVVRADDPTLPEPNLGGWAAHTDHLRAWLPGQPVYIQIRDGRDPSGPVLEGEAVLLREADRIVSWHRRGEQVVRLDTGAGAPPDGCEPIRFVEHTHPSTWGRRKMRYRQCWRQVEQDGIGVWRPWVAVFAGWED